MSCRFMAQANRIIRLFQWPLVIGNPSSHYATAAACTNLVILLPIGRQIKNAEPQAL